MKGLILSDKTLSENKQISMFWAFIENSLLLQLILNSNSFRQIRY